MGDKKRMQTDYKDLECHCAESGLNSVGDGEPWKGFNQASDVIPPVLGRTVPVTAAVTVVGGRPEACGLARSLPPPPFRLFKARVPESEWESRDGLRGGGGGEGRN